MILPLLLIALCVVLRILPHPPNFAPVGAAGVLGGRTLHGYEAFGWVSLFVYGGFVAQVVIARALRRVRGGAIGAAVLGAVTFFLLSNLGVWAAGTLYPPTAAGLWACFLAAVPFFAGTLAGDVLWTVVLVGAHRAIGQRIAARAGARGARWVDPATLERPAL
mgnify:CR=1 FL=1